MARFSITQTDSGPTLFDEEAGECFKSRHSAQLEAEFVFFEPGVAQNPWFSKANPFRILELGFGLGTNFEFLRQKKLPLHLTTLERDFAGAEFFNQEFPQPALSALLQSHSYHEGDFRCDLLPGDFFALLPKLSEKFHCIYFDPFSPKANPEAWNQKLFSLCFDVLVPGGRLVTYSVSRVAKDSAAQAGFLVHKRDLPEALHKRAALLAIRPEEGETTL